MKYIEYGMRSPFCELCSGSTDKLFQEGDQFEADSDGNSNDETACTGAKQWAPHAVCEPIPGINNYFVKVSTLFHIL